MPSRATLNKCYLSIFILAFLVQTNTCFAQWLEWEDLTSTHLTLTSVANSDDEEKDMSPGDLNKDGLMDVIVVRKEPFSNSSQPPKSDLLLMNVNGELVDQTSIYAPEFLTKVSYARDVVIADFDGDGWEDVVIANTFEQEPFYYENLGNDAQGNWLGLADDTENRFPALTGDVPLFCAVWAGDLTGNGSLDIYFVNYKQNASGGIAEDYLFINDGFGVFTDETQTRIGDFRNSAFGTAVELYDMDNDGDLDILKSSVLYSVAPWNEEGLFLLYNDGTGNFSNYEKVSVTVPGEANDAPYMFRVEDYNQDGQLDIFVVDDTNDYLLTSNTIVANTSITFDVDFINSNRIISFGGNVHSADVDLDGDMDIAVADVDVDIPPCNSGRTFAILENVNGQFVDSYAGATYPWDKNVYDFSFLDINNDGLQDIIQANCEGYTIFMNDNCNLATNAADFDLDGIPDACDPCPVNPDPNCVAVPDFPVIDINLEIARQWNEMLLESIRKDFARPTVHARNLFHHSVAMWDIWAVHEPTACTYLLGKTVDGFNCQFNGIPISSDADSDIHASISFASYRLLSHRFANSPNATILQNAYDNHMVKLGYDVKDTGIDYASGDPIALGNYIAQCIIDFGLQDGSNEQNDYANISYEPINDSLIIVNPGNPTITDYNRWQPLTIDLFIDQSGNVIPGATPPFLSPEWGQVSSFGLRDSDKQVFQRNGFDYHVFHDPGQPAQLDLNGVSSDYKWNFNTTLIWSSHLDATDGVLWDISPASLSNSAAFPSQVSNYSNYYDQINGGTSMIGRNVNPVTGQAYSSNLVPRGDFARVLAEFWADGPDSETPPGHWFTILNYVADHPDFEKRFEGQGPILNETEWYVKAYFTMGGAMHDAAITAWGIKGWYDYLRPISAIRAMADLGQSTDSNLPNYHPAGIELKPGYIELIGIGDPLLGTANVNLNKIKVKAWRGHDVINNVDTDEAGVDWILAENWVPYQRPSFVTPPFAGYVSGHSTFSRAAAEILTSYTGDEYFPGGIGTFLAEQEEFLVFEDGPSVDVELQWATYRDAADQSALSRIWGGIHPPTDDIPGRILGIEIGLDAYQKATTYFTDFDQNGLTDACENCLSSRVITDTNDANDYFDWKASDFIEGLNLIQTGAEIIYDATNLVELNPGFEVEMGATFEAVIGGCTNQN